ncbi:hypothetical protein FG386_003576 [Cryptosporidium ryanae]|uniref:uncharacterized protein n=1 Tax=Cryptosporidium ryanae TaxID=515981 RepID=UPI00351A091B|nr:hypothetical protein FG386_003576 [Cryptosporidium ryanae]
MSVEEFYNYLVSDNSVNRSTPLDINYDNNSSILESTGSTNNKNTKAGLSDAIESNYNEEFLLDISSLSSSSLSDSSSLQLSGSCLSCPSSSSGNSVSSSPSLSSLSCKSFQDLSLGNSESLSFSTQTLASTSEIVEVENYDINIFDCIFERSVSVFVNSGKILRQNRLLEMKDEISIGKYMLFEAYLHTEEEMSKVRCFSKKSVLKDMLNYHKKSIKCEGGEWNNFAVNGNNKVFEREVIELSSINGFSNNNQNIINSNLPCMNYGSPSAIAHDNNCLLFIGTIRGYIIVTLDVNTDKYLLLFDPSDDFVSKITSISITKTDNKDNIYLSATRVDGSIFIWKINSQLLKEYLKGNEDSAVLKKSICLLNKSINYLKQGILNHDFIDIRSQSFSKLALFVSDLQGNLFVLLVEKNDKNERNRNIEIESVRNEDSWVISDNIFLYHSDEELIHEFKPFPAPPLIKSSENKIVNDGVNKRGVVPMDYYQLYLVSSKRKFSIISMLPHPALCKIVDVYDDLVSKNIPIDIRDDHKTFLHSNWIRPSVVFKDANSIQENRSVNHPIKVLISIDRYLCIYEIKSFTECRDSDEINIEVNLTTVLELFDTINGIKVISDNLISLLIGLDGVYIYQIMENTGSERFEGTIKANENFSDFSQVRSFRGFETGNSTRQKFPGENIEFHEDENKNSFKMNQNTAKIRTDEFYPIISNIYREEEDMVLVCLYKYGQRNKRLLVVSQNIVGDLNENIQLFNYSLICCMSISQRNNSKVNKVLLLMNDRIMVFTMLFRSWMTHLEGEYSSLMEQLKQGNTDMLLPWIKHSSIFISLFENRLPPLLTWNNLNREMILVITKNIFNSLLNNVMTNHMKVIQIQDKNKFVSFSNYTRKMVGLIVDSSLRLCLWGYLFSEIIPIIKTYGDVSIIIEESEKKENMNLFDYYVKLIIFKLIYGEIEWEHVNNDIIAIIVDWYGNAISICDKENRLDDKKSLLSEVEYLMIRTLKYGIFNSNEKQNNTENLSSNNVIGNDTESNNNLWLRFVPIFKNNNLWTSYIILYLYNGRDPFPLLKRLISVLLNDYYLIELNNDNIQRFNIIDYQYRIENNPTVQKFYHFIFSFLLKVKYPFNEYTKNYKNDCLNFELNYDTHDLIRLLTSKISDKNNKGVYSLSYVSVLIITSIRLYVSLIVELNNRKSELLLTHEIEEENIDKLIVWYEKLSLLMQDKLERFVFFYIKNHNNVNSSFMLFDIDEDLDEKIDFKTSIFEMLLNKEYSKMNLDVYYMVGHYIIFLLSNLDRYNINNENGFVKITKCIFILIRNLNTGIFESKEILFNLAKNIEYYLIMAIIKSNKNNHGINFLALIDDTIDYLDNECFFDYVKTTSKADFVNTNSNTQVKNLKLNDLEINQRISLVLKKYSLYNLSLYLSIQVFDLENILDIFSKEKYIDNNILKELYIIDDNNNNILFSFNYIMSTIEKGIKFKVFGYNHVLGLITKYADLLSNIDSLNTIDLIISILEKCLTTTSEESEMSNDVKVSGCDSLNIQDNWGIDDYSRILREELDDRLYKLLLNSLLFNTEWNIYKRESNSSKWNSFINSLLPDYLEIVISEVKLSLTGENNENATESRILLLLDHWYKNSICFDELINIPLNCFFKLLKKNNLPLGMVYINHIFIVNPTLFRNDDYVSDYNSTVDSCIRRFEEYLKSLSNILNSIKYKSELFTVNIKKMNDSNTEIIIINDYELSEKAQIYNVWNNILELSSFLYIYCFSNNNSQANNGMDFLSLYAALIKCLFINMENYCIEYTNNLSGCSNIERTESSIVDVVNGLIKTAKFGGNNGSHLVRNQIDVNKVDTIQSQYYETLNVNGTQMMVVFYYVLAFHIMGNENYQYIIQKYIGKYTNVSSTFFSGRLTRVFSNQITNYYNFIKPILLLIIKDESKMPCKFWRHLALNMINTRLFINKCNDQLSQMFQNDLMFLFNSLIDSSKKAANIVLFREEGAENVDFDLIDCNSDTCYVCKQYLYNVDDLNSCIHRVENIRVHNHPTIEEENNKKTSYFNLKVVSEGTNNYYIFNQDYYEKAHYIENSIEYLTGDSTEKNLELDKLLVFQCGNVSHKECYYKSKKKFGVRNGDVYRNICGDNGSDLLEDERVEQNIQCSHQHHVSFF